jgi:FkbM family methyltransferase
MNLIKRVLFKIFGLKNYLKIISSFFFMMYKAGLLKGKPLFDHHYFVGKLIEKGDYIIDIGANLGYYSVLFAGLTGKNGKVYSVEPVKPYREVLERNTRKFGNVEIIPYALGTENNKTVRMGIPDGNKYFSHGRTQVMDEEFESKFTFEVTVMNPKQVFGSLKKLDYIKCDIEGYEGIVIPEMMPVISKFLPLLQIETSGDAKEKITGLLSELGYKTYNLVESRLIPESENKAKPFGDIFYIPEKRLDRLSKEIFKK